MVGETLWYVLTTTFLMNPTSAMERPGEVVISSLTSVHFTQESCMDAAIQMRDDLAMIAPSGNLYSITTCVELPTYIAEARPGLIPGEPA